MRAEEKDPQFLLDHGYLEKINDFEIKGEKILASRLGYRITYKFVRIFFARVFENPDAVLNEEMLKPELQDMDVFVDGIKNITEAQKRVAQYYFDDGSVEAACPPLKALIHIMANGNYEGKTVDDPAIRKMFSRESLLESSWYKDRLINKQLQDIALWQRHLKYLKSISTETNNLDVSIKEELKLKYQKADKMLRHVKSSDYLKELNGTIGLDPLYR
jgi:hypothetical protein